MPSRTVYNYFDSKGEILVAGLDDRIVADCERSQPGDHARFAATEAGTRRSPCSGN